MGTNILYYILVIILLYNDLVQNEENIIGNAVIVKYCQK